MKIIKNDVEYVSKLYVKFCLNRLKNGFLINIFLGLGFFCAPCIYHNKKCKRNNLFDVKILGSIIK